MPNVGLMMKELMVEELTTQLKTHGDFFVTVVGTLQAGEADMLRKRLFGAQAQMLLVKRTLGRRSLSALSLDAQIDSLLGSSVGRRPAGSDTSVAHHPADGGAVPGSVGFVIPHEDILSVAKVIVETAKANPEKFSVRGGWVTGQVLTQQHVEELASLPPKLQLIANLIGVIESPITNIIWTIEQVLR